MNRHDLETAAEKLERSGVRFYAPSTSDGANIREYTPVDWQAALVRIMGAFGWVVGPEIEETPRPELRIEP